MSLGGNSLWHIAAAQKIWASLGMRVPPVLFIRNRRIDMLTRALRQHCGRNGILHRCFLNSLSEQRDKARY